MLIWHYSAQTARRDNRDFINLPHTLSENCILKRRDKCKKIVWHIYRTTKSLRSRIWTLILTSHVNGIYTHKINKVLFHTKNTLIHYFIQIEFLQIIPILVHFLAESSLISICKLITQTLCHRDIAMIKTIRKKIIQYTPFFTGSN